MMSPRAIAEGYCRRSWNPVPVPYKTKTPIDEDWQLRVITESDVAAYFNGTRQNVGVVLGPTSKGLTDVDLDCAEAVRIAPFILPKTNAKFGRPSNPDSHWLYYSTLAQTLGKSELKLRDPKCPKDKKNTLLEVRVGGDGHGAQTVFPGSVHESGEPITWSEEGEPATVADNELLRFGRLVAALSLLARYWPGEGARHDVALTVGGFLARCRFKAPYVGLYVEAGPRSQITKHATGSRLPRMQPATISKISRRAAFPS